MARKPVSVYRRPLSKKGSFRYYVRIWDDARAAYSVARSAASVVQEFDLDPKKFSPTSRTGALLIGEELRRRGVGAPRRSSILLVDYCSGFWDWETSDYIAGKLARGQQIGRQYADNMKNCIERHVRPRLPRLRLCETTPQHLDRLMLQLRRETKLGARFINAILSAVTTPIREAYRLGLIRTNPADNLRKLGNDTRTKGILSESDLEALFAEPWDDERHRLAVALGYAAGLRLGEILALHPEDIDVDAKGRPLLWIRASWSVVDGRKSTKTGNVRCVPIDETIRDDLRALALRNPYGNAFIFWSDTDEAKPCTHKFIEYGFNRQLRRIGIDEATRKARAVSFHSLRHAFNASLRGAIPDAVLRKATGHVTAAMTDHYDHRTDADLTAIRTAQENRIIIFRKASSE